MRLFVFALAVMLAGCTAAGTPGTRAAPTPTAEPAGPASLRSAVEQVAASLSFQPFVPTDLPPDTVAKVTLRTEAAERSSGLGEPLLVIEFTPRGGGKPFLHMIQGPGGCCLAESRSEGGISVVLRTRPPQVTGDPHTEVRAQLLAPGLSAVAATLWWHEETWFGNRTYLALSASPGAAPLDGKALIRIAASVEPVDRPGVSGEVLLYWSTHESHSPNGHRIFVGARNAPLPDEVRLVDQRGQVVATATFEQPKPYECLRGARGVAPLAVALDVVQDFMRGSGAGYRVEARLGGAWIPAQLVGAGCFSIE